MRGQAGVNLHRYTSVEGAPDAPPIHRAWQMLLATSYNANLVKKNEDPYCVGLYGGQYCIVPAGSAGAGAGGGGCVSP